MYGVDVAGDAAEEIADWLLIVISQGEALNVGVDRAPEVMCNPLADAGRDVLFDVRRNGANAGDYETSNGGEL